MDAAVLIVVSLVLVGYGLTAQRSRSWNISAPMLALSAGLVVFAITGYVSVDLDWIHFLAEATLALVLFHDAATIRLADLRRDYRIPLRLLAVGFPLALLATTAASTLLLPAIGMAGAVLLAASITPTDAGLGAPTVLDPNVPLRTRRALNVESGLNDGLATPIVLAALAVLAGDRAEGGFLVIGIVPLLAALIIGVVIAAAVARLLDASTARNWSGPESRQMLVFAVPILLLGTALAIDANAFIAAFVGGLVFGSVSTTLRADDTVTSLLQAITDMLSLAVWFVGGGLIYLVLAFGVRWQWLLLAVLALTLLRLVPVWLSLLGARLASPTVGFVGWFGPRGLASIIFALLAIEELGESAPVLPDVVGTIAMTVLLSVFAHGLSAGPLAQRYGRWAGHESGDPQPVDAAAAAGSPGRVRGLGGG